MRTDKQGDDPWESVAEEDLEVALWRFNLWLEDFVYM
jgi:hypothetical protein